MTMDDRVSTLAPAPPLAVNAASTSAGTSHCKVSTAGPVPLFAVVVVPCRVSAAPGSTTPWYDLDAAGTAIRTEGPTTPVEGTSVTFMDALRRCRGTLPAILPAVTTSVNRRPCGLPALRVPAGRESTRLLSLSSGAMSNAVELLPTVQVPPSSTAVQCHANTMGAAAGYDSASRSTVCVAFSTNGVSGLIPSKMAARV